jgi:sec-independent protein translocase protein TatC
VDNNKSLVSPELTSIINKYSPFFKEARKRVLFILSVFAVATVTGFIFYEKILKLLVNILSLKGINIVFTSPFQFINLAINCGVSVGLVVVFPLVIAQVLAFLKPALKKKEYKMIVMFLPFSIILFLIGFTFGFIIMKWQIEIFLARSVVLGIGNVLDISKLLAIVLLTSALMGIGFQFPIVLLLLMRLGLINLQQLSKKRPWVYLGSFIFAILLPPDSILADIFLSLPLIALFELTLILHRILGKKGPTVDAAPRNRQNLYEF